MKNKLFLKYWKKPLITIGIAVGLSIMLPFVIKKSDFFDQTTTILFIGIITWLAVQAVRTTGDLIANNGFKNHQHLDAQRINTQVKILVRIAVMVLTVVGISLALITFPQIRKIGISILASAGVAGVILGVAAQKSLASILAGVQIALTQPIKIGDEIMVENEVGTITEINLTYVVMRTIDLRHLVIPINYFIDKVFQNWTMNTADLLGIVYIEVDYTTPVQKVREALDSILQTTNLWDKKFSSLQVTNAKTNTIELRALVSAANPIDTSNLRCYVREKLIEFMQNHYPHCLPKVRLDIEQTSHPDKI